MIKMVNCYIEDRHGNKSIVDTTAAHKYVLLVVKNGKESVLAVEANTMFEASGRATAWGFHVISINEKE